MAAGSSSYSIAITSGGGNPTAIDTTVKIESIISKDNFATNTVLADITLPVHLDANEAPVITGQAALSTAEETALTITLGDLTVADADNTYPDDFSLTVLAGTNYTVVGATITPAADFNGVLTVPVKVNDGTTDSNTFNLSVTVTAVNDAPVITGQTTLSTAEDTALTITLGDLTVTDPDNTYPDDFSLTVLAGTNYTVVGATITPAANFNGVLTVPVKVNDGTVDSNTYNLSVTVNPANDAPVVGDIPDQTIPKGGTFATINLDNFVSDVDNTDAEMVWTYAGTTDLTVSIVGRVATITTPNADWSGAETITFRATDPGALWDEDAATFTVSACAAGVVTLEGNPSVATANTVQTVNVSHTTGTGADRLMLVGVSWNGNTAARTIQSVTFTPTGGAAVSLDQVISQKHDGATANYRYVAIYRLLNPPSGQAGTVTVNFSGGTVTAGIVVGVANFAGVDQTDPLGTPAAAYSPSNNTTATVTLSGLGGDEFVFDTVFLGGSPPAALTAGAGQTQLTGWNATAGNARGAASTEPAGGNTSVTMSWTAASSSLWVIAAVPINPSAAVMCKLTLAVSPVGGGTTVPAVGIHAYAEKSVVDISATPATGYEFDRWDGNVADPDSASTTVTMNADKTVTAYFNPLCYTLTTAVAPAGSGSVSADPAANCNGGTQYTHGTVVQLTATASPGSGYTFANWTGDASGKANLTSVTMNGAKSVTANFTACPAGPVVVEGSPSVATANTVQTVNVSHTTGTGADRLMLVGVSWNSDTAARPISSVTFTPDVGEAVALNLVISRDHGTTTPYRYAAIYRLLNPPSGQAGTVTVNFSGGTVTAGIVVGVANFAGVDQTTPLGTPAGAYSPSNNTTPTVTLSGLGGDELVFDTVFLGGDPPVALTAGANQTQLTGWNTNVSKARGAASTEPAGGNTSVTMSWTAASSSLWVIAAVPINRSAAGMCKLTMAVSPDGGGTTVPSVGIDTYAENTVVDISATPATGYEFDYWDGVAAPTPPAPRSP